MRVGFTEERAPLCIEHEGGVDQRRVLSLVERALADDLRLVPKPLQPDAHPAASAVSCVAARPGSPVSSASPGPPAA